MIGKKPLIRRSKLQALIVSCPLAKTILEETEGVVAVSKVVFWVDSTAVYFWAKNKKKCYVPFVGKRSVTCRLWQKDLRRSTKQYQLEIRYVNTKQNLADLLTRPQTVDDFKAEFRRRVMAGQPRSAQERTRPGAEKDVCCRGNHHQQCD